MHRCFALVFAWIVFATTRTVAAEDGEIAYHQGLVAAKRGDEAAAFRYFKAACLAPEAVFEACRSLARSAEARGDDALLGRALASAVMARPTDLEARVDLAVYLMKRADFPFAEMHLRAALAMASRDENRALVRYYLAYTVYKLGRFEEAADLFSEIGDALPRLETQRRDILLAKAAAELGERRRAAAALRSAETGPDDALRTQARQQRRGLLVFPFDNAREAEVSASLKLDSHPTSAFLDASGRASGVAFGSIFRADGIYRRAFGEHLVEGNLTLYRDQRYLTFGQDRSAAADETTSAATIPDRDFDLTLVMLQLGYRRHLFGRHLEHELRLLLDSEVQMLDGVPEKVETPLGVTEDGVPKTVNDFKAGGFGVFTYAFGGRLWWSFATHRAAESSLRFRLEGRPNLSDRDRSTVRFRWRLAHTRAFLGRTLRAEGLIGLRYDRTYRSPAVIKYDRLLPEGTVDLFWRSPLERLAFGASASVRIGCYLNSDTNAANSFRSPWQDDPGLGPRANSAAEQAYYREKQRVDIDVEAELRATVDLWSGAAVELFYRHHERYTNLDETPLPDHFVIDETTAVRYGYRQDVVSLVLKQRF